MSMLDIIANESQTLEEFARRVDAWASTEKKPPTSTQVARAWANEMKRRGKRPLVFVTFNKQVGDAVDEARERRIKLQRSTWERLIDASNNNEEDDD